MDRKTWQAYFDAAPASVQDYLLDPAAARNEETAQTKLGYEHDTWNRIMEVVWDLLFVKTSKQAFRERIKRLAGDRKSEDVERDVLLYLVLPLADLLSWDVEMYLQELGVSTSALQAVPRVTLRPVSYGAAARRIASEAKLSLLNEEMARRVRDVLMSHIKGVRSIEQVKEILQRRQEEGGMGWTWVQVEAFVSRMTEFLTKAEVLSEDEYMRWLNREPGSRASIESPVSGTPASEEEFLPAPPLSSSVHSSLIDAVTNQALADIQHPGLDPYLTKRLRNTISTRLREVRNKDQTIAILRRDPHVGGLGFDEKEADRISVIIEHAFDAHHAEWEAEERRKLEGVIVEQQAKLEARKKRESEEHAKWFQEKIQGASRALAWQKPPLPPAPLSDQRRDAAPSKPYAPPRSSVDGVEPPVRLTGLAEELGGLTIAAFRRMARNPGEAAERVYQKLETLKSESFERWTEGVKAWRSSPIEQTYLKLVAESFSAQRPLAELAREKSAQSADALTSEEVETLVALNARIHF